jgi:hypothetical protein
VRGRWTVRGWVRRAIAYAFLVPGTTLGTRGCACARLNLRLRRAGMIEARSIAGRATVRRLHIGLTVFLRNRLRAGRRAARRGTWSHLRSAMNMLIACTWDTGIDLRVVITACRQQRQSQSARKTSVSVPHSSLL